MLTASAQGVVTGFHDRSEALSGSIKNAGIARVSGAEGRRCSVVLTGLHTKAINLWMFV
jgi:hypothetical protein